MAQMEILARKMNTLHYISHYIYVVDYEVNGKTLDGQILEKMLAAFDSSDGRANPFKL